jgi:hypothetical protein
MKHQKTVDNIRRGTYSRSELIRLRRNAENLHEKGDKDAAVVISEIDIATPTDNSIVFMGFCPGADFDNRLDIEWKEKGVCTFGYLESQQ